MKVKLLKKVRKKYSILKKTEYRQSDSHLAWGWIDAKAEGERLGYPFYFVPQIFVDTVFKLTKAPDQTVTQKGGVETKYPCLMRSKNTGSIVLFLGHELGIRIAPPRGCNIEITGGIESNWIMRMFEPFSFQEPELPTQEEIDQQAEAAHPISHGNRWAFRQGADFVLNYIKRKQQKK